MSHLTEKELLLVTSMMKNFNCNIIPSINWDQVAIEASYKDSKNAKVMGSRLIKKLTGGAAAPAAPALAAEGDNDNAGEGSSKASATAGKKRKAADNPQGDSSSAKAVRPTKKSKVTATQFTPVNKAADANVETEDRASDRGTEQSGEDKSVRGRIAFKFVGT